MVLRVEADVADDVVGPAVAVEVGGGDRGPPAGARRRRIPPSRVQSSKPLPWLLWKYLTLPHSRVSRRSGQPSPSTSLHRAEVTMPTSRRPGRQRVGHVLEPPAAVGQERALRGQRDTGPGRTRPPMKSPRRPLRSKSAAATAPALDRKRREGAVRAPAGSRRGRRSGRAAAGIPARRPAGRCRPS